jgi:hypothetical protein
MSQSGNGITRAKPLACFWRAARVRRRRGRPHLVRLSSERASQVVRQDCSFTEKQEPPPALPVVVRSERLGARGARGLVRHKGRSEASRIAGGASPGTDAGAAATHAGARLDHYARYADRRPRPGRDRLSGTLEVQQVLAAGGAAARGASCGGPVPDTVRRSTSRTLRYRVSSCARTRRRRWRPGLRSDLSGSGSGAHDQQTVDDRAWGLARVAQQQLLAVASRGSFARHSKG